MDAVNHVTICCATLS